MNDQTREIYKYIKIVLKFFKIKERESIYIYI